MDPRYIRNIPALTEEECLLLQHKRILITGCGGLGGHITDMLARLGIGCLRVVDGDVFEPTNLNRQLLSSVPLLGIGKARAAAEHIRQVNPLVLAEATEDFLTEENVLSLVSGCDAVLDALDNLPGRRLLSAACTQAGVPYIYGAIQGWTGQAAISLPGDGLIDRLFPEEILIRDKSVLSFTPALCAAVQVSLCVRLLTGRPVETGTIHYFDLLNMDFESIPMI